MPDEAPRKPKAVRRMLLLAAVVAACLGLAYQLQGGGAPGLLVVGVVEPVSGGPGGASRLHWSPCFGQITGLSAVMVRFSNGERMTVTVDAWEADRFRPGEVVVVHPTSGTLRHSPRDQCLRLLYWLRWKLWK